MDSWAWTRHSGSLLWRCQPPKLLCQKSWSRQMWGKTWLWYYLCLFSLEVLCYLYTFRGGAVLSLLAFKLDWADCMPRGKDCNVSVTTVDFSMVELFQKMCTEKSWCDSSAWETAGSDWLHLRDLIESRACKTWSWGWGKIEVKLAFLGAQDCVKHVVVAASTPQTRWKYYLKERLGVRLQLGTYKASKSF